MPQEVRPSDVQLSCGHRVGPHTADCVVEAWGPDRISCLTEAMKALVEVFAELEDTPTVIRSVPVVTGPGPDPDALVALLEEVIYVTDVFGTVPVRFHLVEAEDGGVAGDMELADANQVSLVGPIPKAVSYHGLAMAEHDGAWHCRAVIDV
jgi:SHS2 domain-containing protein